MTLVMDGVRRTGLVIPPLVKPVRRVALAPLPVGTTHRVGMDGIRRSVPTPREMLSQLQAADFAAIPAPEVTAAEPTLRDWRRVRQTASFGIVAAALVTAGVATGATALHTTAKLATPVHAASLTIPAAPVAAAATAPAPSTIAAPAAAPINTGLQQLLDNFVAGRPDIYGIAVKNLSTGETATINGSRVIESASMYKLYVADTIYHKIDLGQVSPSQAAGGGSGNTVAGCLKLMITISDNTCGRALGTIIGWGNQNAALHNDGYVGTSLTGVYPQTSANDIAKLFERLYDNSLNSPAANASFLNLLKGQLVNNRLPQGLPAGTVIAHKTGDLDGYMHDGGIVYGPKTDYVVVVMAAPGSSPSRFADLSSQLWSHFEQ